MAATLAATSRSGKADASEADGLEETGMPSVMLRLATMVMALTACAAPPPLPGPLPPSDASRPVSMPQDDEDEGGSLIWGVAMYLPNRVLDVLDIVRAKLHLGPGFAFGARATRPAEVYVGFYGSAWVGLPGPRSRKLPRLPVGLESRTGAAVSVADATLGGPTYGTTEFGVNFQLALIGADLGLDPGELFDFVVGLATFDPKDDDL
jgi:hypothetical protein